MAIVLKFMIIDERSRGQKSDDLGIESRLQQVQSKVILSRLKTDTL